MIQVTGPNRLSWNGQAFTCALGRSGISAEKWEGDGHTPAGKFALRQVFYRPDRVANLLTAVPARKITTTDGWCDDPEHADYNRLVTLPVDASHEKMWRDDGLYDIVVVLGHNDDPVVPYRGSAIFMHVATEEYRPTEGCVVLALADLVSILAACSAEEQVQIDAPA